VVEVERVVAGAVEVAKVERVVPERHPLSIPGDPRRARLRTGMEVENLSQSLLDRRLRDVQQVVVRADKCTELGMLLRCSRYSVLMSQFVGSREYGSGYPGFQGRGVGNRGFPFFFWPLAFGGLGGGLGYTYLHNGEVSSFIFESHLPPSKPPSVRPTQQFHSSRRTSVLYSHHI